MRPGLLTEYARALPRLQAEEDVRLTMAGAAAAGTLKPAAHRRYVRDLLAAARGPQRARTEDDLRALGVRVIREPKKEKRG